MGVYEKLSNIQNELKAPKGQYNSFGKYNYRSCEDILEAVKPICKKHNTVLTISDELVFLGDRYYIKATCKLADIESDGVIENTAFAREELDKKGMDGSQITGTASSYARKYSLNGLFCIDDTKDADTDEFKNQQNKNTQNKANDKQENTSNLNEKVGEKESKIAYTLMLKKGLDVVKELQKNYKISNTNELTISQFNAIVKAVSQLPDKQ